MKIGEDDGDGDGEGEGESIILPFLLIPSWALAIAYRLPIACLLLAYRLSIALGLGLIYSTDGQEK